MANASIIVLLYMVVARPSHGALTMQVFAAPCQISLRRILAHPLARTYKNVSVDPIQLSSGIVSPQKRIEYNALFQNGNQKSVPNWDGLSAVIRPELGHNF